MKIDTEIVNKILINSSQYCLKRIKHYDQIAFILDRYKNGLTFKNVLV